MTIKLLSCERHRVFLCYPLQARRVAPYDRVCYREVRGEIHCLVVRKLDSAVSRFLSCRETPTKCEKKQFPVLEFRDTFAATVKHDSNDVFIADDDDDDELHHEAKLGEKH